MVLTDLARSCTLVHDDQQLLQSLEHNVGDEGLLRLILQHRGEGPAAGLAHALGLHQVQGPHQDLGQVQSPAGQIQRVSCLAGELTHSDIRLLPHLEYLQKLNGIV